MAISAILNIIQVKEILVTMSKLGRLVPRWPALALVVLALAALSDPTAKTNKRGGVISPDVRNLMAVYGADAVTIDRNARDYKLPDQIEWKGRPGSASQTAVVFGDPSKPGLYVQLLKRGPDDWSQPHSHPNDRFLTVLAGTMRIGTGAKFDRNNTVALGPGSVIKDFANQIHYDGTGPEGLTLEIIAMGPAATTPADGK
jgi:quercetin dioxygenase-like cupin family protein